jgi:hypothetical protein
MLPRLPGTTSRSVYDTYSAETVSFAPVEWDVLTDTRASITQSYVQGLYIPCAGAATTTTSNSLLIGSRNSWQLLRRVQAGLFCGGS